MNKNLKLFLEHKLKTNQRKRIITIAILLLSPALFAIPVSMNQATVLWFVAIILTPFFCCLAVFLNLKAKNHLKGILKAAEDKSIISAQPTIFHYKLFGMTISKQTQFEIKTTQQKKYFLIVSEKEAPVVYGAIIEVRNQHIYGSFI